jgi:Family of unknown function (DUF6011)
MGKYKWVRSGVDTLFAVGILADGSLHNPNGYPEDVVRTAVLAADARHHERRSAAAQKAGRTRLARQQMRVGEAAKRFVAGQGTGKRRTCWICGRGLGDPESIERGIGSECWQGVMRAVERAQAVAPPEREAEEARRG